MELLLNLLWCAIAAGALLRYVKASSAGRREFLLGLGALLCVLILLLPAISITDDLHFEAVTVEDSTAMKKVPHRAGLAPRSPPVIGCGTSPYAGLLAALFRTSWRIGESTVGTRALSSFSPTILGRAPPLIAQSV
jgi:hypothetical protein